MFQCLQTKFESRLLRLFQIWKVTVYNSSNFNTDIIYSCYLFQNSLFLCENSALNFFLSFEMQSRPNQSNRGNIIHFGTENSVKTSTDMKASFVSQLLNRVPMQSIENIPSKRINESPNKRSDVIIIPKRIKFSSPKSSFSEENKDTDDATVQQLVDDLWMIQKQLDFIKDFSSEGRRECDSIRRYLLSAPQKDISINFEQIKAKVSKLQEQLADVFNWLEFLML